MQDFHPLEQQGGLREQELQLPPQQQPRVWPQVALSVFPHVFYPGRGRLLTCPLEKKEGQT